MTDRLKVNGGWLTGFYPFHVLGGPYARKPANAFGVCLLERGAQNCDVWLTIEDFGVPSDPRALVDAIKETFRAMLDGKVVYVGCMGGRGRTGLFLSLLTKVAKGHGSWLGANGPENVVTYVREHFNSDAVETYEQEDFVRDFKADSLHYWLAGEIFKRRFTTWFPRL